MEKAVNWKEHTVHIQVIIIKNNYVYSPITAEH